MKSFDPENQALVVEMLGADEQDNLSEPLLIAFLGDAGQSGAGSFGRAAGPWRHSRTRTSLRARFASIYDPNAPESLVAPGLVELARTGFLPANDLAGFLQSPSPPCRAAAAAGIEVKKPPPAEARRGRPIAPSHPPARTTCASRWSGTAIPPGARRSSSIPKGSAASVAIRWGAGEGPPWGQLVALASKYDRAELIRSVLEPSHPDRDRLSAGDRRDPRRPGHRRGGPRRRPTPSSSWPIPSPGSSASPRPGSPTGGRARSPSCRPDWSRRSRRATSPT